MSSKPPSLDTSSSTLGDGSPAHADTPIPNRGRRAAGQTLIIESRLHGPVAILSDTENEDRESPPLPPSRNSGGAAAFVKASSLDSFPFGSSDEDTDDGNSRGPSGVVPGAGLASRVTTSKLLTPLPRQSTGAGGAGATGQPPAADQEALLAAHHQRKAEAADANRIKPAWMIDDRPGRDLQTRRPNPAIKLQRAAVWVPDDEAGTHWRVKQVKASDDRRGTVAGRRWGAGIGALIGGALIGGVVAGVALTAATGGIGLVVGAAIVGGALGAFAGGGLGGWISSFRSGNRPQKARLDAALRSLTDAGEVFTREQAEQLAAIPDHQWRDLLAISRDLVPDRHARQKARTTLVLNAARHGFKKTLDRKMIAIGAARARLLGRSGTDLYALQECFRSPDGLWLYGPSVKDMADQLGAILREMPNNQVDDPPGLSHVFIRDVVERQLRPVLTDCHRHEDELHGNEAPAKLRPFVGNQDGKQEAVARNLSQYLNQNPMNQFVGRAANLVSSRGDQAKMDLPEKDDRDAPRDPESTVQPKIQLRDPAIVVNDTQNTEYEIAVTEAKDRQSYVVSYWCNAPIKNLMVMGAEAEKSDGLPMDRAKSFLTASMSIRLQREDLAAGNGAFTYVDPPSYGITLEAGAPSPRRRSLHARQFAFDALPTRPSITQPDVGDQDETTREAGARRSVDATSAPFTPIRHSRRPMLFPTASSNTPRQSYEAPQFQQGAGEHAQATQQSDDAIPGNTSDQSDRDD
jgi:hypothetical protein